MPIQRWFFSEHRTSPHHWNQAAVFDLEAELEPAIINATITALITTHSGLRQHFSQDDKGDWHVCIPDTSPTHETTVVSNDALGKETSLADIEAYLAVDQQNYPLTNAPLLRSYLFPAVAGGPARLALVAHHLIIDVVSWQILAEDLQQLLTSPATSLSLAPATAPYSSWSRQLKEMTKSGQFTDDLPFWRAQKHANLPAATDLSLPVTEAATHQITVHLSKAETAPLLNEVHRAFHTNTQDILLAALLVAVGADQLHLNLEHNGREAAESTTDFTRSIGWFTATYPITLSRADDVAGTIISVKEALRKVPNNGLSYGALRYFGESALNHQPQLLFNYMGRINTQPQSTSWQLLEKGLRAGNGERHRIWEINAGIFESSLRISWYYANSAYTQEAMHQFVDKYLATIRSIIKYCLDQKGETFTPSDFPEADLSQEDLDHLLDQIDL